MFLGTLIGGNNPLRVASRKVLQSTEMVSRDEDSGTPYIEEGGNNKQATGVIVW